jgi:hypothetical protein
LIPFLLCVAVQAKPYQPPVAPAIKGQRVTHIVKRARKAVWCVMEDEKAIKAGIESDRFAPEDYVSLFLDNSARAITVYNESEDAYAQDTYYFDAYRQITRLVRTGHYINDPVFSVTFIPTAKGKLVLTRSSQEIVRRMTMEGYDPYIVDWPKFASYDQMPFRSMIAKLGPPIVVRAGCGSAAH